MIQLLVIAGLDPGGGAGILADARVADQCGVRPVGAITALTVQDSRGVRSVHPVDAEVLGDQLSALLSDTEVAAVKIGMLGSEQIARAVAEALALTAAPVVWDPIGAPTAGGPLLYDGSLAECAAILAPHLRAITPNIPEAELLADFEIHSSAGHAEVARTLASQYDCGAVVTGGHVPDWAEVLADVVCDAGEVSSLVAEPIDTGGPVHGTGCAFSTALACELGLGRTLEAAAEAAGRFVRARLSRPVTAGRGHPSVL